MTRSVPSRVARKPSGGGRFGSSVAAAVRLATLVVATAMVSCTGVTLSPAFDDFDALPRSGSEFGGHAVVRSVGFGGDAKFAAAVLRGSELFDSVSEADESEREPDFVFEALPSGAASHAIPVGTMLTLGIIPTSGVDTVGMRFRFVKPRSLRGISVTVRYRRAWGLGWVYTFHPLFPGWGFPATREREFERLGPQLRALLYESGSLPPSAVER